METSIYFDEQFAVWLVQSSYDVWWSADDSKKLPTGFGEMTSRLAQLESIQIAPLNDSTRLAFRSLAAEGIARALDGDLAAAASTFDKAESFVHMRLEECTRRWHLVTALIAGGIGMTAFVLIAVRDICGSFAPCQNIPVAPVYCALMGLIGATLSVAARLGKISADPAAGLGLHVLEVLSRLLTGAVGGFLAYVAVRLGLFFPQLKTDPMPGLLVVGFVAGISERLIPNLVSNLEGQAFTGSQREKKPLAPS